MNVDQDKAWQATEGLSHTDYYHLLALAYNNHPDLIKQKLNL